MLLHSAPYLKHERTMDENINSKKSSVANLDQIAKKANSDDNSLSISYNHQNKTPAAPVRSENTNTSGSSNKLSSTNEFERTFSSLSLSARNNPPRYNSADSQYDPSAESSVASGGSKASSKKKAQKKSHKSKRKAPPVGDVFVQALSGQSSISSLSLSFTNRSPQSRRTSLSNSNRSNSSHDLDGADSVSSNQSTGSRRMGLMGRLLEEMHIIESECFDVDNDLENDIKDDDFEDWL